MLLPGYFNDPLQGALELVDIGNAGVYEPLSYVGVHQSNFDELPQQVRFMNCIYWNASHVLAWLGQDEQNVAEEAFDLVKKARRYFRE